jgi:hypothetical protein
MNVRMQRYRISAATRLAFLADLAAAKGQPELADDIRLAARLVLASAPPEVAPAAAAAAAFQATAGSRFERC